VQAVVAVVGTAQAGFQDLVDRLGLDVVPGVREQLIVEDCLAAIERGQLDDIDQLAGLDDASDMRGIERLAGHLDVGREQGACGFLDLWLVVLKKCGNRLYTHMFTVEK
jgi:hypothetical protein